MIFNNLNIFKKLYFMSSICWICKSVQGNYLEKNYPKSVIEDAKLDTAQLINKYKYPVETHYVTTEDKYILQMHRIPKPGSPPVFLMHGLEDSSATWILMGPEKAPGYYLSDNGYDVWMGNARGNRYSRNHTDLSPDNDLEFWSFSWHEIGVVDLPTMIDYVLEQTGYKKTGYFGHSQGTTAFWVLCSMRPEYNANITMMHALAPVAFMKNVKAPLLGLAQNFVKASKQSVKELFPHTPMFHKMCFTSKISEETCVEVFNQVVGKDVKQTNATMYPVMLGHIPAGCNIKQVEHFLQLVKSNRFCQFDYGQKENMKRYGKPDPPDYPLEKITAPVALYYGFNDNLSSEIDVKRLAKILPNVVKDCPYPKWNHMSVLWGIEARKLAHKGMLEIMKNYPYEKRDDL